MKPISIDEAYSMLKKIQDENNVNVEKQTADLNRCGIVSAGTLIFINKYLPIEQLATYNHIYKNRHKNPLYHNLVNEDLPVCEKAIALSSYLTQVFIRVKEMQKSGMTKDDCVDYMNMYNVGIVTDVLSKYASCGDEAGILKAVSMIRDVFKNIYVYD